MSSSVLDFQLALKAVNGNSELAQDLLKTLIGQMEEYKSTLQTALEKDNREELQKTIHRLNGAMRYVGAPALSALVDPLDGEIVAMPQPMLLEQIQQVMQAIDEIVRLGCYPDVDSV